MCTLFTPSSSLKFYPFEPPFGRGGTKGREKSVDCLENFISLGRERSNVPRSLCFFSPFTVVKIH